VDPIEELARLDEAYAAVRWTRRPTAGGGPP
jgi:hypothetical protein